MQTGAVCTLFHIARSTHKVQYIFFFCIFLNIVPLCAQNPDSVLIEKWDNPTYWITSNDGASSVHLSTFEGENGDGLKIDYSLQNDFGWINLAKYSSFDPAKNPVSFLLKASSSSDLELKFVDTDGSTFGKKISLKDQFQNWQSIVFYLNNADYWWGGNDTFGVLRNFDLAISGQGYGTVWIDEIGIGKEGLSSTFSVSGPVWDPDSTLSGYGFRQRRDAEMQPEDSLVLVYLKIVQDISSPDQQLLPSMEDNIAQTFNNSLAALAFIVKNEQERAERILDFYAEATVERNTDPHLQNFYLNGEARGFYQHVSLSTYRDESGISDRWIGDMAWLLVAYKNYEHKYQSDRYKKIIQLLKELLLTFYKAEGEGGYIQHGWRHGDDKLHESFGHPEGNIDCYAALKLCSEDEYAQNIRTWLDNTLTGVNYPLDLYTWRVLAYGKGFEYLLNIPEYDLQYRKTLNLNGVEVMGFYHGPDIDIDNIWVDGTGHMACAYALYGDRERGYFYANQMDNYIIERTIDSRKTHTLPYTLNTLGGYDWVDTTKGMISCAAWYILAKNEFNPFRIESATSVDMMNRQFLDISLSSNYPNPFTDATNFNYKIQKTGPVLLEIFDINGNLVRTLVHSLQNPGVYKANWDGYSNAGNLVGSGLYFCRLSACATQKSTKVLIVR
ncbi:T9SS type A sorting domain-containing protein [candidate division KSB1 bacterium]|nr:T9SS type A sorting domain-containing protein [candidate division KSB1 bacterium]